MIDRDGVIRHATACADAHGDEVRRALVAFVCGVPEPRYGGPRGDTRMASADPVPPLAARSEAALRVALVAQACGLEACAHDGATGDARRGAAQRALAAWDGVPWDGGETADTRESSRHEVIIAGGVEVRCTHGVARLLGAGDTAERMLVVALSEGLRGQAAAMRAVALVDGHRRAESETRLSREVADAARETAGMELAAERSRTRRGDQ